MTREIKFRAWDKELKQWLQFPLWFEDGKAFHFDGKEYKELNQSRIEIMQYTGLKDKNGKKIYEGDIVKFLTHQVVIEWNNEEARFNCPGSVNGEVIGNIYEHPELLNNKK